MLAVSSFPKTSLNSHVKVRCGVWVRVRDKVRVRVRARHVKAGSYFFPIPNPNPTLTLILTLTLVLVLTLTLSLTTALTRENLRFFIPNPYSSHANPNLSPTTNNGPDSTLTRKKKEE